MSWFVPNLPASSSAGADAAGFFSARPVSGKPSKTATQADPAPDFNTVLKAAVKPVATPTPSPAPDSQTAPDQPVAGKSQKQPNKKSSPSPQAPVQPEPSPIGEPSEQPPVEPEAAAPTDAKTEDTKPAQSPEASVPVDPAKIQEFLLPAIQSDLPVAPVVIPVTPTTPTTPATPATSQTPPAPVSAGASASPSNNSSSASVKVSPFLNAFDGIAEGYRKLELAQGQSKSTGTTNPANAAPSDQAAAPTDPGKLAAVPAAPVTESNPLPQEAPATSEGRSKSEKAMVSHSGTTQNASGNGSAPDQSPPALPAAQLAVAPQDATSVTPTASGSSSPHPAPTIAASPLALASISPAANQEAAGAQTAHAAQESPAADPQQTFDQVVLGLRGNFDARNGTAEIQLNPPNLGTVHVSVAVQNGALTAQFQSDSDMVRGLLKDNLDKLKTVLEGQGVAVDRLAVDAPPASGSSQQSTGQQQSFGSAAHDGRSAGQYQEQRSGQRRSDSESFSRAFRQAADASKAPIDLVA